MIITLLLLPVRIKQKHGSGTLNIVSASLPINTINAVAISNNRNRFIVTSSDDNTAKIWNLWDKTAKIWDFSGNCLTTFEGHTNVICLVAISSDNSFIIICMLKRILYPMLHNRELEVILEKIKGIKL